MDARRTGKSRVRLRAIDAGRSTARIDLLATEEPMEMRVRYGTELQPVAVTMRTPGADFELAAGYLFAEGLIASRDEIARIEYCLECADAEQRYNIVTVVLRGKGDEGNGQKAKGKGDEGTGHWALAIGEENPPLPRSGEGSGVREVPRSGEGSGVREAPRSGEGSGVRAGQGAGDWGKFPAARAVTSACGLCGKERLDDIERRGIQPLEAGPAVGWETIVALPERLRDAQGLFDATGGLHAAALFTAEGELLAVREDVGRHNAVDKVIGWAFLEEMLPLSEHILMVSGRSSFEIAQKALAAGIPILCAVSAPSSLAVDLAQRFGMTLVGFLRGERFNVYAGHPRIQLINHTG